MKIGSPVLGNKGLFKTIGQGGLVKNLNLENCIIDCPGWSIGGIAGANDGTVENCAVSGSISGTGNWNDYIGGIVGMNLGKLENCYSTADVTATNQFAGGVAGSNGKDVLIKNCYATGNITGTSSNKGGIVGGNYGKVENCVALNQSISGTGCRIANNPSFSGQFTYNYAREDMLVNGSTVTASNEHGANVSVANVKNEAWWKTTSDLDWDFDDVWEWNTTNDLPVLHVIEAAQDHILP